MPKIGKQKVLRELAAHPYKRSPEIDTSQPYVSMSEVLRQRAATATAREKAKQLPATANERRSIAQGWRILDLSCEHVEWLPPSARTPCMTFNETRAPGVKVSPADAWRAVLPENFYEDLLRFHIDHGATFRYHASRAMSVTEQKIVLYHAMRIWLLGSAERHRRTETRAEAKSLLRDHFREAIAEYNATVSPAEQRVTCGLNVLEMLHSTVYIPKEFEEKMTLNLLSIIDCPGEISAGDEKAFGGLHEVENMKASKDKPGPDQVAQWFQTLCGRTRWNRPFLYRPRLFQADSWNNITDPPAMMSAEMCNVQASLDEGMIVTDCLYATQASALHWRNMATENANVRWLMAVSKQSFRGIIDLVPKERYQTPGHYVVLFNDEHKESFCITRPADFPNEVRYTYSNCFRVAPGPPIVNQIYDAYNTSFSICDKFNRLMGEKSFKSIHRRNTGLGARDDFCMTFLLVDAWVLFEEFQSPPGYHKKVSFKAFCIDLAHQLMKEANTM